MVMGRVTTCTFVMSRNSDSSTMGALSELPSRDADMNILTRRESGVRAGLACDLKYKIFRSELEGEFST